MDKYVLVIILFGVLSSTSSTPPAKTYRTDYAFNRKTDAFYKLHTESVMNREAQAVCQAEGGRLMVPSSPLDIVQVHGMLKQFPDIGNQVWIGEDGLEHESSENVVYLDLQPTTQTEGYPTTKCEVVTRKGETEIAYCYQRLPFVCKVASKDAHYDSRCGVYGTGYVYYENVGSCYKIPDVAYSWNQAYDECAAEGAHLLVLNSELEHEVVRNVTRLPRSTPNAVNRPRFEWFFFAGVRAEKTSDGSPRVFKTIFGQTLKEAGFDQWSEHEPNNIMGREYCGSIFRGDGKYNDLDCSHTYSYICEKEVPR